MPAIQSVNFSHLAIARWLIANPEKLLGDCAAEFGYSRTWLSIIIHSDAFKAVYGELQKEANSVVMEDVPTKLHGLLDNALEGLADQVAYASEQNSPVHRDFLLKTSDTILSKLGYGGSKSVVINQHGANSQAAIVVDGEALSRARSRLIASPQRSDNVPLALADPEKAPS